MTEQLIEIPSMGAIEMADTIGVQITAIQTAMELELFTIIADGNHSLESIKQATGCHPHGLRTLLDALCPVGLLQREHDQYKLTATAQAYLVRGSPTYCMPIYLAWLQNRSHFTDFVRTGRAGLDLTSIAAEELWSAYAAPDRIQWPHLVPRIRSLWETAGITPTAFPQALILDIGCGSGCKSFALLQADPHAHVVAIDYPKVLTVAKDIAIAMGVSHQVTFSSNGLENTIFDQAFDIVLFGSLLHYYDDITATNLLRKAYRAIRPTGIVVVNNRLLDEERSDPVTLFSAIDVHNCAPYAQHRTFQEFQVLLAAGGFNHIARPLQYTIMGRKLDHPE